MSTKKALFSVVIENIQGLKWCLTGGKPEFGAVL